MKHILFVCSRNRLRSPTAEEIFAANEGIETASAGLNRDADVPVTRELLEWAEIVFVMERAHRERLERRFRTALRHCRVVCLDVPDRYEFMDPELVAMLRERVTPHLS